TGFMYDQRQQHLSADFRQPRPKTANGQAYGVLQIPKLDLNQIVVERDNTANMRGAPAHRVGPTRPGEAGTIVVLGHHSRFGGPFGRRADLVANDSISLQAKNGDVVEYHVACNVVVSDGPSPYLIPGTDARLVLVTASGGLFSGQRRVVIATTEPTAPAATPTPSTAPTTPTPTPASPTTPTRPPPPRAGPAPTSPPPPPPK